MSFSPVPEKEPATIFLFSLAEYTQCLKEFWKRLALSVRASDLG